jgi:malate dehydrogenase
VTFWTLDGGSGAGRRKGGRSLNSHTAGRVGNAGRQGERTMTAPIRVAVTGAAGRIAYSLLFRIAAGGMFGPERHVELRLMEAAPAMPLLDATVMELHDCALPLLDSVSAHVVGEEAFAGADWIILLGSAPYRPGMTRNELLRLNGPVFQAHGRSINDVAKTARVLSVANPCNTNCLIARSVAHDVPAEHWFAMMRLDQSRARALLAGKAGVPVNQVANVTAWGTHSPNVFPDVHNALIGDRPAPDVIGDPDWVRHVFEPAVRGRGEELRRMRGASPAGSASQAIIGTIRALTTPTPFGRHFSVGVVSDGSYGVPAGLVFGFPVRTEDGKTWHIVQGHYLDEYAQDRIAQNVSELEFESSAVTDLLGEGFLSPSAEEGIEQRRRV